MDIYDNTKTFYFIARIAVWLMEASFFLFRGFLEYSICRFELYRVCAPQCMNSASRQKPYMRDIGEVFRDLPDIFFGCHPVFIVKTREIHRPRI